VAEHTCSRNESNDNIRWNKTLYSLLYFDLRLVFCVLKYLYSVISVIVDVTGIRVCVCMRVCVCVQSDLYTNMSKETHVYTIFVKRD